MYINLTDVANRDILKNMKNKEFTLSIFRNDPAFAHSDKEDLRIRKTFLMQALIRLMEKQSFEQISVIDICNEALVHRATFYKHYKDKYDLLTNTLETLKIYIFADAASDCSYADDKELFLTVADCALSFFEAHRSTIKNVLNHNKNETMMDMIFYTTEETLKRFIECRMEQTNATPSVPLPVIVSFFSGGFSSLILWWINHEDVCTKNEILSYITRLIESRV